MRFVFFAQGDLSGSKLTEVEIKNRINVNNDIGIYISQAENDANFCCAKIQETPEYLAKAGQILQPLAQTHAVLVSTLETIVTILNTDQIQRISRRKCSSLSSSNPEELNRNNMGKNLILDEDCTESDDDDDHHNDEGNSTDDDYKGI